MRCDIRQWAAIALVSAVGAYLIVANWQEIERYRRIRAM
jgi:hypothetical protein